MRGIGRVPTTAGRKQLLVLALVAVLLVAIGVLGLGALNASNGRVETLGLLSQQRAVYGELQLYSGLLSDQLTQRNEVVNACESSVCDQERVALLFDTDGNIQTWLASVGSLSVAQPGAQAADQRLLGEIHSRYTDIANALPRLLTADNNTNFAESGPYLDNRPQALEGAEIDSDATSLVSTAKSDATNVSRQNQASYAELQHLFIGVAAGGGALVLLVAITLCWWLVRPTRKAGIGAPLQSTIER